MKNYKNSIFKYSLGIIIGILILFPLQIEARTNFTSQTNDTIKLQLHHIQYLIQYSIEQIFSSQLSNPCINVVSISDYLWELPFENLFFTFEHTEGNEILGIYHEIDPINYDYNQDLSAIIPEVKINYNVLVKHEAFKENKTPNSSSTNHMVHMRFSDLYMRGDEISIFLHTRCKLLTLDQYMEDVIRIHMIWCPYGELIIKKMDSINSIQKQWPRYCTREVLFNSKGCMEYQRRKHNRKMIDD